MRSVSVLPLLAILLPLSNAAAQNIARCSVPGVGFIANNTIEQCARIGQAYRGQANWGSHQLSMAYGRLVVDGRAASMVANESGTYGSLSQRCQRGDIRACQQHRD